MNARCLALVISVMILGAFSVQDYVARSHAATHHQEHAAVATYPAEIFGPADKPSVRMFGTVPDPKFVQRHEYYVQLAGDGHIDIYFVGDSILDGFQGLGKEPFDAQFGGWRTGNFACSGDHTQHALWRLKNGELAGVKPKLFIVLIGTNNLLFNTNDEVVAGNAAILKLLRETNPQAKILLLALFPRADEHPEKNPNRIDVINAQLAKLADGNTIRFLNLRDKLVDAHGNLPKTILRDGIHPSAKGYDIIARAIRPIIVDLIGPPPTPSVSTSKSGG